VKVLFCPLPLDGKITFRSEGGKHALLPSHLRYRAPELFGSPYPGSPATDLYALAACLLEAATGTPPFAEALSPDSVLVEKNKLDRPIRPLASAYPTGATSFFSKALHPDPLARFQEYAPLLVSLKEAICPKWKPVKGKRKGRSET
jgi:serine/threonine protein kinase